MTRPQNTGASHEDLRRHQVRQLPEGEVGVRQARAELPLDRHRHHQRPDAHHRVPEAQWRRAGAGGRVRRRPDAGAVQCDHPLPGARYRHDPCRRLGRGEDGRVDVLGAVQPRALHRRLPLPDGLSRQVGRRPRSGQDQARLCGAGADGAPAGADAVPRRRPASRSPTWRCSPTPASRRKAASTSKATRRCGAGSPRARRRWGCSFLLLSAHWLRFARIGLMVRLDWGGACSGQVM